MKRGGFLLVCIAVVLSFVAPAIAFADESTMNLVSVVLESFDPGSSRHDWYAQGSQFITSGYPKWTFADAWPEALYGSNPQNLNLQVLGVNGQFDRQGYNRIDVFPVTKDSKGNTVPDPLQIPGRVRSLDVWVWGSNHTFDLEVELEDYTGVDHVLKLGSLDYAGWKDLTVNIPPSIPQSVTTIPRLRGLKLVKFMVWTEPTSDVSNFYVYFDQIKVLTDTFETRIDGEDLASPDTVQKIWSGQGVNKGQ